MHVWNEMYLVPTKPPEGNLSPIYHISLYFNTPSDTDWFNESGITEQPTTPGFAFIKPDQRNPWIEDQLGNALLSTISHLQLPNFVSCGRDKPSHMTHKLVTVGAKFEAGEWFLFDPWSMDQVDLVG